MAQEFKPGQIVPESGIYTITHDRQACGYVAQVTVAGRPRVSDTRVAETDANT